VSRTPRSLYCVWTLKMFVIYCIVGEKRNRRKPLGILVHGMSVPSALCDVLCRQLLRAWVVWLRKDWTCLYAQYSWHSIGVSVYVIELGRWSVKGLPWSFGMVCTPFSCSCEAPAGHGMQMFVLPWSTGPAYVLVRHLASAAFAVPLHALALATKCPIEDAKSQA